MSNDTNTVFVGENKHDLSWTSFPEIQRWLLLTGLSLLRAEDLPSEIVTSSGIRLCDYAGGW